jgi:DNA-binding response OmpR family regulator
LDFLSCRRKEWVKENPMDTEKTVLLVEDEPALRDLIALILQNLVGCRVVTAGDGEEALKSFSELHPQAVVLDILLPYMNGLDLLRKLKEQGDLDGTGVIVISALGYPEVVRQAAAAGANDFLVKPFDPEILAERVKTLFSPPGVAA